MTKLDYLSNIACFFVELIGTALLAFVVLATTDKKNGGPPGGMLPVALFLALLGLGAGFGMQTCASPLFSLRFRAGAAHRVCVHKHSVRIQPCAGLRSAAVANFRGVWKAAVQLPEVRVYSGVDFLVG